MTVKPILVLGGTGKTGSRVAAQLREKGFQARPASRSGEVRFDWSDQNTWEQALSGVGAVYMVDLADEAVQWDATASTRAFAKLAVASGVRRIVLLQARTEEEVGGKSLVGSEREVQDSGVEWTVLRPTWFNQNFSEGVLLDGVKSGELRLPAGDGLEPFVDCEDVAAVAVAALVEEGHAGQTYEISGGRMLTFGDAVAEISKAIGREVRYVALSAQEYIDELVGFGVPEDYARMLADLVGQIRDGKNAYFSDGVSRALHREPLDFTEYARRAAATGVWNAS